MKYYLHDTNAFQDEKITLVYIRFGYEGIGLFFTILEKLALHETPLKTVVLKKQLGVGKKLEKVWLYLEEIELISSKNGETFNKNILKFGEKFQKKREETKKRVAKWRDNQEVPEIVTRYESVRNTPNGNGKANNTISLNGREKGEAEPAATNDVKAEEKAMPVPIPLPPSQPAIKPIPFPVGTVYGDGELKRLVTEFYQKNPDAYPLKIYVPFVRFWTKPYDEKGSPLNGIAEKWRAMNYFEIDDRLTKWMEREANPRNGKSTAETYNAQRALAEPAKDITSYGQF